MYAYLLIYCTVTIYKSFIDNVYQNLNKQLFVIQIQMFESRTNDTKYITNYTICSANLNLDDFICVISNLMYYYMVHKSCTHITKRL